MARFILPALALAGTALAQCNGSVTITTSSDAEAISSCTKYNGDITIDPSASGQISIDGVQTITGDFTCINATQLTSLGASVLQTIEGTFNLQDLTIMSSLSMSYLNAVNKINWITLPALQSLNFANGVSQANTVYISNTALTTLSGIELTQVGSIDVNNNNYLKTINVNSLTNVTNALSFSANGLNLDVEFPNLQNAANLTFRNISSLSMPSLSMVEGAMGFYSNYFDSFEAPNMTQIGGTIAFVSNSAITNISFPQLESIGGGLQLANNSQLATINGFPQLTEIEGDIDFYGTFNTVQLSKLTDVRGAANVVTSSQNSSVCSLFQQARSQHVIKGNVNCQTNTANSLTNGSSTSSGSGSSSTSKSAADSTLFDPSAPLTGVAAFIAALLFI